MFLACDNSYNGTLAEVSSMSNGEPFFIRESWSNNDSQSDYFKSRYYFRTIMVKSSFQHRILNFDLFRWNHYLPLISLLCLIAFGCFYWLVSKLCDKIQNPNQRKQIGVLTVDSDLETITKTNAETSSLPSYEMVMQQKQKNKTSQIFFWNFNDFRMYAKWLHRYWWQVDVGDFVLVTTVEC